MTPDDLNELYRTYRESAFRLECRDVYAIPGEDADFDAFLSGQSFPTRTVDDDDWLGNVRDQVARGKYFGRVRLIGHPITDYTRFQMLCYPRENLPAGEEVRILDRRWLHAGDEDWTRQDFWMFDDRIVVLQHFDSDGHILGVSQATDPDPYVAIRRRAVELSVPFDRYRSVRPPAQLAAVTPAEILAEEFLTPHGLDPLALATALHVPPDHITALLRGAEPITADLALRLGRYFGTTPQFWLNLQHDYDLAQARDSVVLERIEPFQHG